MKGIGTIGILGLCLIILGLIFFPSAMIITPGMLPTLAAAFSARRHRALKAFTIGSLNFAGCMPFLIELWGNGQTVPHAAALLFNPRTLIVIYCAAVAGYLVDWGVGSIAGLIMTQRMQSRLQTVRTEQTKLAERWGADVSGEATIHSAIPAHEGSRTIGEERR